MEKEVVILGKLKRVAHAIFSVKVYELLYAVGLYVVYWGLTTDPAIAAVVESIFVPGLVLSLETLYVPLWPVVATLLFITAYKSQRIENERSM